jgi:hypothetical protein
MMGLRSIRSLDAFLRAVLAFAAILKGEIHQGAVSGDFAVFNLKIQFLNFRDP